MCRNIILYLSLFILSCTKLLAQEDSPFAVYDVPAQNLLKYNRFLINPTFSTVREDKSYLNLLHRNQSVQFDNNNQNYFLSYSGRIDDRSGLGLSLYAQNTGVLSNFGVLANYAYGVKLTEKSNFTFGANISYYKSGLDQNRLTTTEVDPLLAGFQDQNLLSFQPGINLSYGKFDVGVFAENLFDYNLKSTTSVTEFGDKTFSGHLQYTHEFENKAGIFEDARLLPLARLRKAGSNKPTLGGSLILDLPKLGWAQAGYDSFYGAAAGLGVNINRRVSLGYTMEKGLSNNFDNFGITHEISFAYSFTPNLTEDRVMLEEDAEDELAANTPDVEGVEIAEDISELESKLAENDAIIAELMFRQDSLESARQADLERRFEMVMRMVRNETKGKRPDLEKKAKELFLEGASENEVATRYTPNPKNGINAKEPQNAVSTETGLLTENKRNSVSTNNTSTRNTATKQEVATTTQSLTKEENPTVGATTAQSPIKEIKPKEVAASENNKNVPSGISTQNKQQASVASASQHKIPKPSKESPVQERTQDKVRSKTFKNLPNVEDGYYVVANVYKGGKYMEQFLGSLHNKGIAAAVIDNKTNGLKYVYLKKFKSLQEAQEAASSGLNGSYNGATWVMNVNNKYTNEAYAQNVSKLKNKASKYNTKDVPTNAVKKDQIAGIQTASAGKSAKKVRIKGTGEGYYLIANVFANPDNANRFVKLLNSYGLHASYFINPENNYRYVYLKKHDSWNNALISYYTKLNDAYNEKMWIMRVSNSQTA